MKANFNLALRVNPQTKEKQWYAVPASKGALDADETAAMAVADTTLSKGEYKHAMEVTSEKLIAMLLSGVTITIGDVIVNGSTWYDIEVSGFGRVTELESGTGTYRD